MPRKVKVGLIGCGNISEAYFAGCKRYDILDLTACADLDFERARAKAEKHGVRACTVAALLANSDIEIIINLTIPQVHAPLNERILRAGKHAYTEKPFALDATESRRVLTLARKKKLLVGSAPDTFLGGGIQTARQLLDDGVIGRPLAATAMMTCPGHESWHPSPEFYYKKGGGPMFDMGPYYVTALVNLLGPVRRVSGTTKASVPYRLITSQPLAGKRVKVEVPTHYSGTMDFANGAVGTIIMSFDTWPVPDQPCIVIYGSEGTMIVPDPNRFDGPVKVRRAKESAFVEMPHTHSDERLRGTGVADMAYSILRRKRRHRCSGDLAHHVVEVMSAFEKASKRGRYVNLTSTVARPALLPPQLPPNLLDQ
ncbi:MAG: Gfo/Idh/MocA family oxidoreductase [Opitutaceae bacterium]|nr:Gfo/Idh/MocA family oxidoreductase [Opitutaceae bacterium]MBP9913900.1 Gfo/Idh/MocA family oxidoreductase [Opitutaceae bacterium]